MAAGDHGFDDDAIGSFDPTESLAPSHIAAAPVLPTPGFEALAGMLILSPSRLAHPHLPQPPLLTLMMTMMTTTCPPLGPLQWSHLPCHPRLSLATSLTRRLMARPALGEGCPPLVEPVRVATGSYPPLLSQHDRRVLAMAVHPSHPNLCRLKSCTR